MFSFRVTIEDRTYFVEADNPDDAGGEALSLYMLVNDELPNTVFIANITRAL